MSKLLSIISGTPYDAATYSGAQQFNQTNVPYVGQEAVYEDGRRYRFVSSAVDVLPGQVVALQTFNASPIDNLCTAASAGATQIIVNTTSVAMFGGSAGVIAADRLVGGSVVINDDTGEGYTYEITANTAGTASANVTLTIQPALIAAIDGTTDIFIVGPKYSSVVLGTATLPPIGVACVAANGGTNTRTEYFWVQTHGICGVRVQTGTSIAIGTPAAADASGGVKIVGAHTDLYIGDFAATETTATGKVPVNLRLA